jgi:hypothetical protein
VLLVMHGTDPIASEIGRGCPVFGRILLFKVCDTRNDAGGPWFRRLSMQQEQRGLQTQLLRRDAQHALEVPGQMALVGETHGGGNLGQRAIARPCRQQ